MLHRYLRVHHVFGAGTDVGKTLLTTALCRASVAAGERTAYVKPIGTGGLVGDDGFVRRHAGEGVQTACLFSFGEPVSPHLAAQRALLRGQTKSQVPSDDAFVAALGRHIQGVADNLGERPGVLYVETAGGVHSPVLSGSSQLVASRALRLPALLIGSPALGGISSTVSAYESLMLHGYDLDALLILREEYYQNYEYLAKWGAERELRVIVFDPPPERRARVEEDRAAMLAYYRALSSSDASPAASVTSYLQHRHSQRLDQLESLPRRTLEQIWWPFTQHGQASKEGEVTVIDSAYGDFFAAYRKPDPTAFTSPDSPSAAASPRSTTSTPSSSVIAPYFDGSATWWTQTIGHASPILALAAASAAGRYGHALFPNCTHAPAVELTERLLQGVGKGWASRVFFSDDGSTAVEVALKMALTAFTRRHGLPPTGPQKGLGVLGLRGSYHGDTIGAMDASEKSAYNARVAWYEGKGVWLEPPTVQIRDGGVAVIEAEGVQWATSLEAAGTKLGAWWRRDYNGGLAEVYDVEERLRSDPLAEAYRLHLGTTLQEAVQSSEYTLAALILEPVVMGAGGMLFVDPLFQRILIDWVRANPSLFEPSAGSAGSTPASSKLDATGTAWSGLPVIFDEVFTGLRRLGRLSGAAFLGGDVRPDIATYAKILTAGTVSMGTTLASDAIFQAFHGDSKIECLLHGHSYTANPIGCAVAVAGLQAVDGLEEQGCWEHARAIWQPVSPSSKPSEAVPWSLWDKDFVHRISALPGVEGTMALGSVLAIYLKDSATSGYTSAAATELINVFNRAPLIHPSTTSGSPAGRPFSLHARPLGNVAYFISSLNTSHDVLAGVENILYKALSESLQ